MVYEMLFALKLDSDAKKFKYFSLQNKLAISNKLPTIILIVELTQGDIAKNEVSSFCALKNKKCQSRAI
jgi:hypothetical protein